jgi:integrase
LVNVSGQQLQALHIQAMKSRAAALSEGTKRNINTQLKAYLLFACYFEIHPKFPVTLDTLSAYIAFLANSMKAPSTVLNYLAGLKTIHKVIDLPFPLLESYMIKMQLKGVAKQLQHTPHQAQPISPQTLIHIYDKLDFSDSYNVSLWASFIVAFFTFARLSNIVPMSANKFDPHKDLTRADIFLASDGLLVHIKWSKTIQDHSRYLLIPLVQIPQHPLCPLNAVNNMIQVSPASPNSPAFSYKKGTQLFTLTHSSLVDSFRILLSSLGLDPLQYSGHSFRRAGASYAFSAGVRSEQIQHHGDWRSTAYLQYIHFSDEQKTLVSNQMVKHILTS